MSLTSADKSAIREIKEKIPTSAVLGLTSQLNKTVKLHSSYSTDNRNGRYALYQKKTPHGHLITIRSGGRNVTTWLSKAHNGEELKVELLNLVEE